MPFIRGRYHINPVIGEALEAAREAEEALLELQREAEENGAGDGGASADEARGPVHRVDIEAAEMVRPQTGRGGRGFTVRVHRGPVASDQDVSEDPDLYGAPVKRPEHGAETHVFAGHQDLLGFLRDELEKRP